jgi:hypothetical protein
VAQIEAILPAAGGASKAPNASSAPNPSGSKASNAPARDPEGTLAPTATP